MRKILPVILIAIVSVLTSFMVVTPVSTNHPPLAQDDTLHYPDEKHFKNVQQLTFGGDNAEAYFSFDGKWIIFQRTNPKEGIQCDRIFMGKVPQKPGEKFEYKQISNGKGRTSPLL